MTFFSRTAARFALVSVTVLGCSMSFAEYRLTVFPEGEQYREISNGSAEMAAESFSGRRMSTLDFFALNNYCVAQIMTNDLSGAISSCEAAISKVHSNRGVSRLNARKAEASILSNLAVARAKSGDLLGARRDIDVALSTYSRDASARVNLDQISMRLIVSSQN